MNIPHIPVLYKETLGVFENIDSGYIIDCTLGYAGHSEGLLKQNSNVKLICNDQDNEALEFSKKRLEPFLNRVTFNKGNFETVLNSFKEYDIRGILADIGVSSLQLDKEDRGFGFDSESLDMRMNQEQSLEYLNKAIEFGGDTYYFHRVKSLVQAKLGDYKAAIQSAQKSLEISDSLGKDEFDRMNKKNIIEWMGKLKRVKE